MSADLNLNCYFIMMNFKYIHAGKGAILIEV